MKKYSAMAILLAFAGTFFTLAPFTSLSGALQNLFVVVIGVGCILTSYILFILAFAKKEKGILKFLPLLILIPILYFLLNFRHIMGGV
ncbi:hypothetical protein I7V34_21715 [Bacillus sp. V3]|nr:hypothetical protein I7V34_21715 [Bacillus sp. V3]